MKKLKMAILGTGRIAETMAATIQKMEQVELYAVASRKMERAKAFAEKYGFLKAYGSYEELVQEEAVELVYIATPHSHHLEHAKLCLQHQRPVLCEKSFTANAAQAEELISISRKENVFLMEAMWTRFLPLADTIQRILNGGALGKLTAMTANLGFPVLHKQRITAPELAGGALLDLGVYPIHFAARYFGWDIDRITSDVVMLETGVDAQESIIIKYQDGKLAQLFATAMCDTDRKAIFYGEQGRLEVDGLTKIEAVRLYDKTGKLCLTEQASEQSSGYEYEVLECIRVLKEGGKESPKLPLDESLRVMQQMDAIRAQWGMKFPFEDNHSFVLI